MEIISASEERFWADGDAATLQNAVDYAAAMTGRLTIPRHNPRTGRDVWIIEKSVLLPDEITVMLDGAHLRMADGVRENVFRNRAAFEESGRTAAGEQHGIRIIGRGGALLDGGEPNGMCEQLKRDHPDEYPPMWVNIPVLLINVRDFSVEGLKLFNSRYWGLCFAYCRRGTVRDICFEHHATLENQDGVDLRVGCSDITLENITGLTGDDTVALTGLDDYETAFAVAGKSRDIHDITIRNIVSATHGCAVLRFLNEDGIREYNITVDGIKDTGEAVSGAAVLFGTTDPYFHTPERAHKPGDFRNITVRNVTTCAQRALDFAEDARDVLVENVTACGGAEVGVRFRKNFSCDGLTIRDFTFAANPEMADCVFSVECDPAAMRDVQIERVRASSAAYVFRGAEIPVTDFEYDPPRADYFSPDKPKLASAYGRYFRTAYGKVIENRPPDSRFAKEKP